MKDAGLNPDLDVFEQLDDNNDGKITWEEFRSKLQPPTDVTQLLKKVFNGLDSNKDGSVSREELSASLERLLNCSELRSKKSFRTLVKEAGLDPKCYMFQQLDSDRDGKITWAEFEANLQPKQPVTAEEQVLQVLVTDAVNDVKIESSGKTLICCF